MDLKLICLHSKKALIKPCVSLLFDEWPDGKHERLEILEARCPNPPCSLVLVSKEEGSNDTDLVIGHCRIIPVKNSDDIVYIEQAVIDKRRRRCGLGTRLLQMTEEYCAKRGYKTIFLTTLPQIPQLYLRLGYRFTEIRPHVVGSGMLDYAEQVPLSSPYQGWECYHKIYAGTRPGSVLLKDHKGTEKVGVPTWSLDVDGYCFLKKDI